MNHEALLAVLAKCPKTECPECGGKGEVMDDIAVGQEMRSRREAAKLSGREVARRLGFSAAYVSDLELGRRGWSNHRIEDYLNVISPDFRTPEPFQL